MTNLSTKLTRPRILRPGVQTLEPGVERFRVRGGGSLTVQVFAGDRLRIIDIEGRQPAEILVLGKDRGDSSVLGTSASEPSPWFRKIIASSEGMGKEMAHLGVSQVDLSTVHLFGHESRANEEMSFMLEMDGVAVIATPDQAMTPGEQTPPTDLEVWIERADSSRGLSEGPVLPDPLADPLNEFRIARSTANA